ncbi:inositol phosphorylceramide synthase [Paenibacillus albiflavus]|uniref:Inositol phosphorylceramide synthase n=1 Tax=Paenibacillus albiflavus TaxID=2545760 RepID=A0A4R4E619_9BACL|nr:phosphatase PAP2 family protein [Paenibacillus albiflavus]TCZ75116.1 inositol phosphorylceramide synthase [Paenibacillus albiflavus]
MGPFDSMTHVSIYTAIIVIILLVVALRTNPITIVIKFVQAFISNGKNLLHLIAVLLILYMNKLELQVEQKLNFTADFAQTFSQIEGKFVENVQHFFYNDLLTYFTSFYYVIIFTTLMIVSIGIYIYQKNYQLFYALCYAILITYIVAMPFYLFFPVTEVWYTQPKVDLLIHNVFPTFEQEYRLMSGIDNCFPSLHTSLSVTMAFIAARSENRFWRYFTAISAVIVIFSIFYLGIHWFLDMCGGLALGIFAAKAGQYIADRQTTKDKKLGARVTVPSQSKTQNLSE